jgi:hypothetical protein
VLLVAVPSACMLSLGARIKPFGLILTLGRLLVSAHYQDFQGCRMWFVTQDMTGSPLPQTGNGNGELGNTNLTNHFT